MTALVNSLATVLILSWIFSGVAIMVAKLLYRDPPRFARTLFHELRPFYLPAVVVAFVTAGMLSDSWWRWLNLALNVWNWWRLRNLDDDDDRWKRRRKRLAEQVSVSGGRLVVVSGGAR
ncbi:hypothetical protein [Micromonospora tarensis]|uniref:Uncharacterized protein n=1 Tax=Micromonospora tarensis TaxID=2806100 RepID=A0ABS1YCL5_9ACTN|nr:hypothetical protein [Micromonospora tarensis]MBM0275140.1 hypothetical protein [Micromonospora tarensis]